MNLIRYYNQNRKKIWGILISIASVFILIQLINQIMIKNNDVSMKSDSNIEEITNLNTNTSTLITNQSVVTGENLSTKQLQEATTIIDNFISYCNNKELQKAYDLLTDECKRQMYDTLEVFEQSYYNHVFAGERKICTIENWLNNTYKVKIIDDILATGKSNNGYAKQDYITVKKVNDEYKLNINNYIGYTQINNATEKDNIIMEVLGKNTYMEYEEYIIKVTNNTQNMIILDRREDVKSLYLQDSNGVKYSSYSHELTDSTLTVAPGQTKEVTIKFYSSYRATKKIEHIVFSKLLLYNENWSQKIEFKANV